nr:ribonuclease H-like domain-containing protein [Tanacetum cinerariifolium]
MMVMLGNLDMYVHYINGFNAILTYQVNGSCTTIAVSCLIYVMCNFIENISEVDDDEDDHETSDPKITESAKKFLNGLDPKFEPIKREILRVDPLPTAEAAYATVRKEAAHQIILGVTNETHGIATGLIAGETDGMCLSTKPNEPHDEFAETVNTATESKPTNEDVQEQGESIVEPAKYVLSARANRGIPAK